MSIQFDLADEVAAVIQAASGASALPLAVTPVVHARVNINRELVTTRKCFVMPAGFESSAPTRGNSRFRTFFIDIAIYEPMQTATDPASAEAVAWLRDRYELVEAIDALDYGSVEAGNFESTEDVSLNYESPTGDDDSMFFKVVRLRFVTS